MTSKCVLVAYGTKHGATAGIASEIGRTLREDGLDAREHITFGGSVTASTPGFIARAMVRAGKGGDFRNPERIRTWAHHISAELAAPH
ncbi:hypothetical protein ACFWIV_05395 [Streptomyces virginiae]|uniref:hypothetical protein n=1 Tax=Streptomyces virginiae TaxID=1961 RepID=UPI0036507DDA